MSAVNSKRSWVQEMDDPQDESTECKAKKMAKKGGSRENSNSRKQKTKPNRKEGNDADNKPWPPRKPMAVETDPSILQRRQKQIDYGKNTVGYHNYVTQIPINQRTKEHPRTPDKYTKYSRRSWDTLIKMWRVKLHEFDTESDCEASDIENIEIVNDDDTESDGDDEL